MFICSRISTSIELSVLLSTIFVPVAIIILNIICFGENIYPELLNSRWALTIFEEEKINSWNLCMYHEWFVLFSELKLCLKLGECSWWPTVSSLDNICFNGGYFSLFSHCQRVFVLQQDIFQTLLRVCDVSIYSATEKHTFRV